MRINWKVYQEIQEQTRKSLIQGEEWRLSQDEIDNINAALRYASDHLAVSASLMQAARDRYADRQPRSPQEAEERRLA